MTTALKQEIRQMVRETLDNEIERIRELGNLYERVRHIPGALATPEEVLVIQRGRAEFARGEFVTLDQLFHDVDSPRRKKRAQKGKKISK